MLVIRRIYDKSLQEKLCLESGSRYNERAFAYFAANGSFDGNDIVIDSYIGVLQFTIDMGGGYIETLSTVKGVSDDEALIIMTRAAMEYMDSIDLPYVYIDEDAADPFLIDRMGFKRDMHGEYSIDLGRFYQSPCEYK